MAVDRATFASLLIGRALMFPFPLRRSLTLVLSGCVAVLLALPPLIAQPKPTFTVGWSVYVGWNPYYYMQKSGILRKWADKYGINIKRAAFRLRAFARRVRREEHRRLRHDQHGGAGYAGGRGRRHHARSSSAIIPTATTRCSRGNGLTLAQIPGKKVLLVEKTVSQYLFERAMAINGLGDQIKQVQVCQHFGFRYRLGVSHAIPASRWWSRGSRWCRRSRRPRT